MVQTEAVRSIISSKLHLPRLANRHVPRSLLIDALQQGSDRPLTLVCAPAGSGKSTLLSEWLSTAVAPGAWISLDERDSDLSIFLSYVLAAVQNLFPDVTFDMRNLLQASVVPPMELLATTLSNDLDRIERDFHLVLDDYHLIANPQIDDLLLHLLRHPPQRMHLIVATRGEPPWPLATLRARGQMTEIRFDDLRFTAEESGEFVRKSLGDAYDRQLADALYEESEGWAAGLHLMTLIAAGHDHGMPRDWRELGGNQDIATYLFGEVLALHLEDMQNQLLQMSILRRFNAELCEAVCDHDVDPDSAETWGKAFVSRIVHLNLFVIPLGPRQDFFRFHHLFRRFLDDRLRDRFTADEIATLHRRASDWFGARGWVEEALDHALAAGDVTAAGDLVARYRHDLYNHEEFTRLTRLLRLLPLEAREPQPELLLAEARVAAMNWRFTETAVLLDRAEFELKDLPLDDARAAIAEGELLTLRGILDLWDGNAGRLLSGLQRALELLPPGSSHLRGLAYMGVAAGYWQQGDRAAAWAYVNDQLARTSSSSPVYATLLQTQAFMHWLDGDLANLLVAGRRLLDVSEELGLADQIALAHYFLGLAHFARNELAFAEQELEAAVAARYNMRLLWWCQASGMLALTCQALGEQDRARQTLSAARDFLLQRHAIRILPNLDAFQAEIDRLQGRLADASAWVNHVEPGPLTWPLVALEPRLAQARTFLAEEREQSLERATALIAELHAFCQRVPNRRLLMEVEVLAMLLDERQGRLESALERGQRLVLECESIGYFRLFADHGEAMERLLRQLAARRVAPQTVARLLSLFPSRTSGSAMPDQAGLVEPLTERELEILNLLAERDSNREIATQLYIAPSTVKRHTLNIYRKLGVNDRKEASARAAALGLLPTG